MLAYCRGHGNRVTHVVLANLSRPACNVADQSITLATFKQLGIIPVSCDETIENSAAGKLSCQPAGTVQKNQKPRPWAGPMS
jgi:DNA invertase Pin-like site-specific DNA recombinase